MFTLDTCRSRMSTDTIVRHLADSLRSVDTRPTSRPTLGRDIDRHLVERRSTCYSELVDRPSPLLVDTWSVGRSTLGRHLDRYVTMKCWRHIGRLSVV